MRWCSFVVCDSPHPIAPNQTQLHTFCQYHRWVITSKKYIASSSLSECFIKPVTTSIIVVVVKCSHRHFCGRRFTVACNKPLKTYYNYNSILHSNLLCVVLFVLTVFCVISSVLLLILCSAVASKPRSLCWLNTVEDQNRKKLKKPESFLYSQILILLSLKHIGACQYLCAAFKSRCLQATPILLYLSTTVYWSSRLWNLAIHTLSHLTSQYCSIKTNKSFIQYHQQI